MTPGDTLDFVGAAIPATGGGILIGIVLLKLVEWHRSRRDRRRFERKTSGTNPPLFGG